MSEDATLSVQAKARQPGHAQKEQDVSEVSKAAWVCFLQLEVLLCNCLSFTVICCSGRSHIKPDVQSASVRGGETSQGERGSAVCI